MVDRENVIKGLECCFKYETNIASGLVCEECPYNNNNDLGPCTALLHRDTLELLKEQEPRVLDIDELKIFEVVWFEARNHLYIEPMLTRGKNFADAAADLFRYGKEWRCWTSKPTKEQCEAAKWNERPI